MDLHPSSIGNNLSACYITGSELLFILLQLIIVSFVELKGKNLDLFLHFQLSKRCRKHKIEPIVYIYINRTY